jgi:hypothetical protein
VTTDLIRLLAAALPQDHPLVAEAHEALTRATPLDTLPLSNRTRLALLRGGYRTVEELRKAGPRQWAARRLIGPAAVRQISQALGHP